MMSTHTTSPRSTADAGSSTINIPSVKIAALQLPTIVGDPAAAVDAFLTQYADVPSNVDLVVTPELMLSGYPPQDLLLRQDFLDRIDHNLQRLAAASSHGPAILVGSPHRTSSHLSLDATPRRLTNAALMIVDGEITTIISKRLLPTYAVFDEARYFLPGPGVGTITLKGLQFAVLICEDLWGDQVLSDLAATQPDITALLVLNASPFHAAKQLERQQRTAFAAGTLDVPVLYVNASGATDELVFDGGTHLTLADGHLVARLPAFQPGTLTVNIPYDISGEDDLLAPWPHPTTELYEALVSGLSTYVAKNGFKRIFLGLSGGIDSALTATLAVDALGASHVTGVALPSQYSSAGSIDDARELASRLGIELHEIPITPTYDSVLTMLGDLEGFSTDPTDVAHQNVQARLRSIVLMGFANLTGSMVIATGNKSEMSLGYATLYGDMAGGFAPLKDLYKTEVYRLANWRNEDDTYPGSPIPFNTIDKPPSAELAPDQTDTADLGSYDIIDAVLEPYIDRDMAPDAIAILTSIPLSTVRDLTSRVDRNEYKRRQAPLGIRLSRKALGADRRLPISIGPPQYNS